MRSFLTLPLLAICLASPLPANAQMAVVDHSNLAKAIETARNTLRQIDMAQDQIREAQRLYESANKITDVSSAASVLNSRLVRKGLPDDIEDETRLLSSDLSDLGSIGDRASRILEGRGLSGSSSITAQGAARNQAVAESRLKAADEVDRGLGELKQKLAASSSAKETADIQARSTLEVAQLLNAAERRQSLKDAQEAADDLRIKQLWESQHKTNMESLAKGALIPKVSGN